jgi:DNA-3-methyladenine glycosylase II
MSTGPVLPFDLKVAKATLAASDPHLAKIMEETREFQLRMEAAVSPYEALMRSIVYQSISGKAASAIFARITALGSNDRPPTPQQMLKLRSPTLRKAGLSHAKIAAMKDLAQKTIDGIVPTMEQAEKMSDEELVERLVSVKGIGVWTVEMFLIFRLGRPDVLPIHDLGVKKGWSVVYGKKRMPKPKELLKFGERWRPYRTVASWYMWRAFEAAGYKATNKIAKALVRKKKLKQAAAAVLKASPARRRKKSSKPLKTTRG